MSRSNLFAKLISLSIFCSFILNSNAQSLPIDFESNITTSDFVDFDGGTATVISNPQSNGMNTSAMVAQIIRNGGQIWAGSKIELEDNLDFTTLNSISMKIFTSAPIGTTVKFKLEGTTNTERDVLTTVSNEWETLTWDFTGEPSNYNSIVFMFDFGNLGDGTETSTFLFDDIEQEFGGIQIDLPVDFEDAEYNYTMTDFGGNLSSFTTDPLDANNNVIQAIKTEQAATWAGTTIGTPAGFASDIPLTLDDSKMTVRVWSPEAGTPIRLKVEDSDDPTHTCETETNTTLSGEWEILEFDFNNQAPGTQSLSIGLGMGWTYNMASIFFNFGTEGAVAGEKTYYFDDVRFGELVLATNKVHEETLIVFPNPTQNQWNISSENSKLLLIEIFDVEGRLLSRIKNDNQVATINASAFAKGIYFAKISSETSTNIIKLMRS